VKVFALCAQSFEPSVKRAAGVKPLTSPPVIMEAFNPAWLQGYDFLYFKLHGFPSQPYWYGDGYVTAVSAHQIKTADLSNTIVFVANCHLCERVNGDLLPSPMLVALLEAGAKCVVGGPGTNYAAKIKLVGADLLGFYFRLLLGFPRITPNLAFRAARARLALTRDPVATDTLGFRFFVRTDEGEVTEFKEQP